MTTCTLQQLPKNKSCTLVAAVADAHKVGVEQHKPRYQLLPLLCPYCCQAQYMCCIQLPKRQVGTSCRCRYPPTHKE
jgi:hypothetical protein